MRALYTTVYVLIHVIKHNMDPNSNVNYRRKIGPVVTLSLQIFFASCEVLDVGATIVNYFWVGT